MGRYIIKLDEYYLEWSTIVDAPVTFGMKREDFEAYYREMYGINGMRDLSKRLERADKKGTSSHYHESADDVISGNRAGPNESKLTRDEIYQAYCLMESIRDGWTVPAC
jgi:hypothetical protein